MNQTTRIEDIPLTDLRKPSYDVRDGRPQPMIDEMAESLQSEGQIEPIIVTEEEDHYEIIAGHTRYLAAQQLRWSSLRAEVHQMTETEKRRKALKSNVDRSDMTAYEVSQTMLSFRQDYGMSQKEIARTLGYSQAWVSELLSVFDMPENIRTALRHNQMTVRGARELIKVKDPEVRDHLLQYFIDHGIPQNQIPTYVRNANKQIEREAAAAPQSGSEPESDGQKSEYHDYAPEVLRCVVCGARDPAVRFVAVPLCPQDRGLIKNLEGRGEHLLDFSEGRDEIER